MVIWLLDEYKKYTQLKGNSPKKCKDAHLVGKQIFCNYIDYKIRGFNHRQYYFLSDRNKKSWNQARDICSDTGGHLPIFTSRQHLEELLAVFKLSTHTPPSEVIHIGLKYDFNQVLLLIEIHQNQ